MADPREISEEYYEILAIRELRKTGFEIPSFRVVRRADLSPDDGGGYEFAMAVTLVAGERRIPTRLECLAHRGSVTANALERVVARLEKEEEQQECVVFATTDYEPEAVQLADRERLALLRVVDGREAFAAGGWGVASQYPFWLPEFTAQVLTRAPWGEPRYESLETGRSAPILERLTRTTHAAPEGSADG